MQLPSQPSHSFIHSVLYNNSCKCQPDPYCLSSIPECLISVSSPTVIIYHSVSLTSICFSLLCPFLCLVVSPLLLLLLFLSRFDSSHHICNPSDPLPCLPAFSHVGSSILSAQLTVGHVVMRERQRGKKRERR